MQLHFLSDTWGSFQGAENSAGCFLIEEPIYESLDEPTRPSHKDKEHENKMEKRSKKGAPKSEKLTSKKTGKKASKAASTKGAKTRPKKDEDEGFNFKECKSFSTDW